ncbi:DNA-binding transcriptional regulator, MerR family [Clostridium cavendishii DSM 21758]|uniref:DNA-binding transcriptional regulator, MerR family n=1 Tax=Clostridium cavendishii DSM 21758 TaxID=1121302 RepID=A0A1M6RBA6_9CLOT|nr:MerR family transcriptional regulator [Clostridium cavendishii]SHK29749.1 DNA-binding transcriptional regulator, MerR family [Clostridium cavendishii DSM 21758]
MKEYYKIGEISKIYEIGRDSLMYYEEIGILKPFRDKNGYRLYRVNDIWKLNLIKELRTFGFSMAKIKEYLDIRNIENTKAMLNEEIFLLDKKIDQLNKLKKNVIKRLEDIEEVTLNKNLYEIQVTFIEDRKAIRLNGNIIRDEEVDFLVKKLQKKNEDKFYLLGNYNVGAVYCIDKIRKGIFNEYKSVFCLLDKDDEEYDLILGGGLYITYSYSGNYKNSERHIPKILRFVEDNGYKIIGDPIEIYKIDIHETANIEEFITEIQVPVVKDSYIEN